MEQKICLDTDFAIEILKDSDKSRFLKEQYSSFDIFVSTVAQFELLLREKNLEDIENFMSKVKILDFDESASRKASAIYKELKRKGKMVDYRDLFIASICIVNHCKLATFNKKHFENIKELELV